MDNIYVYFVKLPRKINEAVRPCADGYTVYIKDSLDDVMRIKACHHAVGHIENNDFDKLDVQWIENVGHVG